MSRAIQNKVYIYILLYILTGLIIFSVMFWLPYERNDFPLFRMFIIFFATILLTKYFVYMVVSPWYDVFMKRKETAYATLQKQNKKKKYTPLVSVVIPAWNEEVGLVTTVKTVLASTYRNVEVIVVNDGSTDSSDARMRDFVREYESTHTDGDRIKLVYSYKNNGGKGTALNHGIGLSSGRIIISIDADCALTSETIGNFVKYFEDPHVHAAVGNVKIGNRSTLLGTLQYLEFLFSFYFKKADSLMNTIYIIGGAAGAFRREVFDVVGLYSSENITEDIDLSVRIQEAGMKIVYAASAIVYTEGASTIAGLSAQRLRWKRGRFQTFHEHRKLFFSTDERHNKLLTWFVLPFAIFGDTQLFFEIIFLCFLYVYSFLTHDFSSFVSGIIVVSSMFCIQIFDDKNLDRVTYLLAPIGWLLFYITTFVEYRALIKSMQKMMMREQVHWQKWKRSGCLDTNTIPQEVSIQQ
jgi:biofilm PGA synthesis N-glycosyltransferase PgaC